MQESIQITIRQLLHVTAVTHLLQVQQRKISTLRSAPSAIRSTQASRKQLRLADVLISSIRNMVCSSSSMAREALCS